MQLAGEDAVAVFGHGSHPIERVFTVSQRSGSCQLEKRRSLVVGASAHMLGGALTSPFCGSLIGWQPPGPLEEEGARLKDVRVPRIAKGGPVFLASTGTTW